MTELEQLQAELAAKNEAIEALTTELANKKETVGNPTIKVGKKTGILNFPAVQHNGVIVTAVEIGKSETLFDELVEVGVITLLK